MATRLLRYLHFLLSSFFAMSADSFALTPLAAFDTFGTGNGLSQATVHCVVQDARGYLWIGTDDGLNRYDGTQFVQYHSEPGDSTSLSNNSVWSICEDKSGNIWVGTQKAGLNKFDRRSGTFQQFLSDSLQKLMSGDAIVCILEDQFGDIWAGSAKSGLVHFDHRTSQVELISSSNSSLPSDRIRCLIRDGSDGILIGTSNKGLVSMQVPTADMKQMSFVDSESIQPFANVQNIALDAAGNIWVATLDAGVLFCRRAISDRTTILESRRIPALGMTRVRSLLLDRQNSLWIATASEGLVEFDIAQDKLAFHRHDRTRPEALGEDNLLCLALDRAGDLWVGTWSSGLARMRLRQTPFQAVSVHEDASTDESATLPVLALQELDDSKVLIGTVGSGIHFVNFETAEVGRSITNSSEGDLSQSTITSFAGWSHDTVLVGTYNSGVYLYAANSGFLGRLPHPENADSLKQVSVLCVQRSAAGGVWIGTVNQGLLSLHTGTGQVVKYSKTQRESRRISDDIVYSLFQDHSGSIWVGTLDGLDCIGTDGSVIHSYKYSRTDPHTISNNEIRAIAEDERGNLWIGTSNGLCRLSSKRDRFDRFTESTGLANNVIYGLLLDDHDNVWVSTNHGISVVRAESGQIENFFAWDGLPSGEFNQGACFRLNNGDLLFGGSRSLVRFDPDSVRARQVKVVITSVRDQQNNEYLTREPRPGEILDYPHFRRHLIIDYSAIEFYGGVQRGYAYRMSGVTDNWVRNVPTNSAVFTNLEPGDYRFEVKREGAADSSSTALRVLIRAPWWKSTEAMLVWFASGGGLVTAAVLGLQRVSRKRAIAEREKSIQISINRRHLLDLLSIFGHNQTTKECLKGIVRNCNRLKDPDDTSAVQKLKFLAADYISHTSEKIDDLPAQIALSHLPASVATPFTASARSMDKMIRDVSEVTEIAELRELAPKVVFEIQQFETSASRLIGNLSEHYQTSLAEAVDHVFEAKGRELFQASVKTTFNGPKDTTCFMNRSEFVAMFDDLISNSIEAMQSSLNRLIEVRVEVNGDHAELYLKDTGHGLVVSPMDWGDIFLRRFSTKANDTGGLGLFNARKTMLRYQGEIRVHESSPGIGTTLRLTFRKSGGFRAS